ncbi:MAG: DUF4339 domain-containing protein [Proteobacteria bacterium]|nr:DUF4339 domain-containing protein [Pseudomonadota bacterium]
MCVIIRAMDVSERKWWIRHGDNEEGPLEEEVFQNRLRAGEFPLSSEIKSSLMNDWAPLLSVISSDTTFRRQSTMPPSIPIPEDHSE